MEKRAGSCNESLVEDIMEQRATNEDNVGLDGRSDELENERDERMNKGTVTNPIIGNKYETNSR